MNLDKLFSPQSIAVIGASTNPEKIGYQLLKKLINSNLTHIYPINPKHKQILNRTCFPTVLEVPGPIDQAIVAVPAPLVPQVALDCVNKKIKSLVIISAGFSETGPAGAKLESKLKNICASANLALLGPNCLGYAVPKHKLDLTFAQTAPQPGNIAIISQSGAIGSYLFDWAKKENLGFSKFISLGNRAGINENHCLTHLGNDPQTKVIGLYLESFADGKTFLKTASLVSREKPVIVLFGGQTKAGHKAAQSHTAALSPETDVVATAINQAGCIQANNLDDLINLLEIFSLEPPLKDKDLVIVSNAGGPSILATDQADRMEFDLTSFSAQVNKKLKQTLPPQCQLQNPVDLLGDAMADRFQQALSLIVKDKAKDAYLIILTPQTMTQPEKTARIIVKTFKNIRKPVVVSVMGGKTATSAKKILSEHKIATIDFPQKAVDYLNKLYLYWHQQKQRLPYPVRQPKKQPLTRKQLLSLSSTLQPGLLTWKQTQKISRTYKLPLIETKIINQKNILQLIKEIGFPLVLKSDPSEAIHRTEKQGLYLNLKTTNAVKKAFNQLKPKFQTILAQPQIMAGQELFIGLKQEPNFPPLITIGSGGIYTEIYQDVAHAFLPLNKSLAKQLLNQTKIGQIIHGVRGQPPLAINQVIELMLNLSRLMLDLPQIKELDINPAIVSENNLKIVDIKIII